MTLLETNPKQYAQEYSAHLKSVSADGYLALLILVPINVAVVILLLFSWL